MSTASKNASAIASLLSTSREIATDSRPVYNESTFELNLQHPKFSLEDFELDAGDYRLVISNNQVAFGSLDAWTSQDASVYKIVFSMEDAMTRQKQAVSALAKLVENPGNYVIGLHKTGQDWVISRNYAGDITELTPNDAAVSNMLNQLERLPEDPTGELFYKVHMVAGINGGADFPRISNKPLNTKNEKYTHFAIDQLLSDNAVWFYWTENAPVKWLATVLGRIQAAADGDEQLLAIYRQHYDNTVTRKQVNYAAYKDVKAAQESGEVLDFSLVGMGRNGSELNLETLKDKVVLAFSDDQNRVRATITFTADDPIACRSAERLIQRGYSVDVIATVQ